MLGLPSGIGRVSIACLCKYFGEIDIIDCNSTFLEEAEKSLNGKSKIRTLTIDVREWNPDVKYDLFYAELMLTYLLDSLGKCREALEPNGIVMIKENAVDKPLPQLYPDSSPKFRYIATIIDGIREMNLITTFSN